MKSAQAAATTFCLILLHIRTLYGKKGVQSLAVVRQDVDRTTSSENNFYHWFGAGVLHNLPRFYVVFIRHGEILCITSPSCLGSVSYTNRWKYLQ